MKKLFSSILTALSRGESLVLCSIIKSSGSTPRGSGAAMAVFEDGSIAGTVGGGPIEYQSILYAAEVLKNRTSASKEFFLSPNQIADIGMICGGQVEVYFRYVSADDAAAAKLFSAAADMYGTRQDSWLLTSLKDGAMAVYTHEKGLPDGFPVEVEELLPLLCSKPVLAAHDSLYILPLTYADTLYLFGGGHISQELLPVLVHLGFSVVLYEDRYEFSLPELFPGVSQIITAPYSEMSARLSVRAEDYIVIMTRGHQGDYELLEQSLRTPAGYVGVIGSRHKIAATNKRLSEAGISDEDIARIHTPIGLPIGAETPAEIAISVAAELIQHRSSRHVKN